MTTIQETKQEKAVRLINQRLPKVRKGILKGIGNLASSQYDLSEEQVTEILGYLKSDVATVEKLLRNKKSSESFEVNIT
tara:strand:+ start:42 stop:278 length:237 start_codon:yes stop_codon:yes gene_type:complete